MCFFLCAVGLTVFFSGGSPYNQWLLLVFTGFLGFLGVFFMMFSRAPHRAVTPPGRERR